MKLPLIASQIEAGVDRALCFSRGQLSFTPMTQIYNYHLFFCTHSRHDGTAHCEQHGAQSMRDYAKQRVKDLKLKKVRVNNAGCLNRCNLGPMLVIYPEGIWYRYESTQDIDEIIESHLIQGKVVERLQR